MSEIIYTNMLRKCSSKPQENQELEITKKKGLSVVIPKDLPPLFLWKAIAATVGIICLALLLSVGVLATKLNQKSFNTRNIYNEERSETGWNIPNCPNEWYQRGENCYYLSRIKKIWNQCLDYCTSLNSTFLKFDTEEEMNFIKKLSKTPCENLQAKFFMNLYYDSTQSKWVWLDGTDLTLNMLPTPGHENVDSKCIYVYYSSINAEDCQIMGYCICKKNIQI
ncbi:PREDICTED: natural killer cells antigen CD94-like isoform X2 [Condylura cristata]|uniref:natural killer cells antigen CD94-like isoform X2 n=1 Tax=Condylura cristata TaxID=143302 RepID=UPI000642D163|nr:PREDICTED: natural killer cells antigen CD94-like isoform X2 [Condylura cristata]